MRPVKGTWLNLDSVELNGSASVIVTALSPTITTWWVNCQVVSFKMVTVQWSPPFSGTQFLEEAAEEEPPPRYRSHLPISSMYIHLLSCVAKHQFLFLFLLISLIYLSNRCLIIGNRVNQAQLLCSLEEEKKYGKQGSLNSPPWLIGSWTSAGLESVSGPSCKCTIHTMQSREEPNNSSW